MKATLYYTLTGGVFEYTLENVVGFNPADYTLVYYKDAVVGLEGRLANPQPVIIVDGAVGSLPHSDDANNFADYSEAPDEYVHKTGAKLWLVATSDIIVGNELSWTNMGTYLYEMDLMAYTRATDGTMVLPANGGGVNFEIVNQFDIASIPAIYTITTNVLPA